MFWNSIAIALLQYAPDIALAKETGLQRYIDKSIIATLDCAYGQAPELFEWITPSKIIKRPERIESGWWDDALVMRDYFIVQGEASVCYWVYRERVGEEINWFLQGLFG